MRVAVANVPIFGPDQEYVAARELLVNGVVYKAGDPLPGEALRPERLEKLCRQRAIQVRQRTSVPKPKKAAPPPEPELVEPEETPVVDIDALSLRQLQALCRQHGVKILGNEAQLRKRLRTLVG